MAICCFEASSFIGSGPFYGCLKRETPVRMKTISHLSNTQPRHMLRRIKGVGWGPLESSWKREGLEWRRQVEGVIGCWLRWKSQRVRHIRLVGEGRPFPSTLLWFLWKESWEKAAAAAGRRRLWLRWLKPKGCRQGTVLAIFHCFCLQPTNPSLWCIEYLFHTAQALNVAGEGWEAEELEPGAGWRIPGCCLYGPNGCLEHTLGVTNDVISFVWEKKKNEIPLVITQWSLCF